MLRFIILSVLIVVSGCVSSISQLRKYDLGGNTFQVELARQYLDFAETEADNYDWFNSAYFARKGLKVMNGENPPPEDLINWKIDEEIMPTMEQARDYLVSLLTSEVAVQFPEQAARAQFMFDCWVEQQEEEWQMEHIAYCREEFYTVLDALFEVTTNPKDLPERPDVPEQISEASPPSQEVRLAYFALGSDALDQGTKRLISSVISRLKDAESYDITLNGYADRSGSEEFNMKLSKKRAMAIKKAMIEGGLNQDSITIFAFGETEGRVSTKDGAKSKENRVVEVVLDIRQ